MVNISNSCTCVCVLPGVGCSSALHVSTELAMEPLPSPPSTPDQPPPPFLSVPFGSNLIVLLFVIAITQLLIVTTFNLVNHNGLKR